MPTANNQLANNWFRPVLTRLAFLSGLMVLTFSSGCSTLTNGVGMHAEIPAKTPSSDTVYRVEMQGGFGKSGVYQGDIDGPITVQTALERCGAIEKFRGMDITLYRVVQENGQGLKLPVTYEYRKRAVAPNQDYALHPNDRIVVSAKSNNLLDKMVDSLSQGGY